MSLLPLGMIVEGSVCILLAVTIGYCVVLNRRLRMLHADRDSLRKMVTDLMQATDLANSAVQELKAAAVEADQALNRRLQEAENCRLDLAEHVHAGTVLVERIAKITSAARSPHAPEPAMGTEKVRSALQQLAMHPRIRGNAA
jgi:hypothetical protein